MSRSAQPNTRQAALWNDASGKAWVEMQPILDEILAPFERLVVDAGYPREGGNVLDIGCGAGATTLAMARRVGNNGRCVGLDISQPLVALATERTQAEEVANASFEVGDAQTYAFESGRFDAVVSRFGIMFFDDPVAALSNIRQAARRGGKLAFVAWRSPAENDFMTTAARAAAPFLPTAPAPDPDAPGQFAFADGAKVKRILEASGWSSIDVRQANLPCKIAEGDLMMYATRLGPLAAALREADQATAEKIITVLPAAFAPFVKDGQARFNAACWLVTALA
ncbi:methylase involved in ubiquinone/menaquinone biosynthesis [Mesorhizobium australicum WSM2073]|uniref:Methylase involved in ubiquinone/menaquinone biosynthesis n=1 Tax=Mesorhizobium australicum (strain HAMBI 3006 / LMG 24608 / WSM2073) TaxID=754035 RepID=L0KBF8_MESAW|nr:MULTISPECIES: class I SAM-dependent methyltransferase [Mesorhizobium]AGB42652.1 methylase involved in ubiquinone/menaquinone biosynthesis [Mesorhizobium australicum WSM2073]MBZ9976082.1 class I SAM-dependent methyltransferase [Mesorhizobium sp. BR-1-1-10]